MTTTVETMTIYQVKCDVCGSPSHHMPTLELAESDAESIGFVCYTHNDTRRHLCSLHRRKVINELQETIKQLESSFDANYSEAALDALESAYAELSKIETALKGAL